MAVQLTVQFEIAILSLSLLLSLSSECSACVDLEIVVFMYLRRQPFENTHPAQRIVLRLYLFSAISAVSSAGSM
jgi:hypothetical protein